MIGASRYFSPEDDVDMDLLKLYNSTLLYRWMDWMKREYPDGFIHTQIHIFNKKKPLRNFIGIYRNSGMYAGNLFFTELKNAMSKMVDKVVIQTAMFLKKNVGHANAIMIDNRDKTVSVFEPNGSDYMKYMESSTTVGEFIVKYLSKKNYGTYTLKSAGISCPRLGPQALEAAAGRERDPRSNFGFCAVWALMYTHYHLMNPGSTHEQIQEAMLGTFTGAELEKRVMRYVDRIMRFTAGFVKSPLGDDSRERCMRFVRYHTRDPASVIGMKDPINETDVITRENRERYVTECRDVLGEEDMTDDSDSETDFPIDPEDIPVEDFQFDSPGAARCIRSVANVKEMRNEYKFDKPSFVPSNLRPILGALSPKAAALIAKIQELDDNDMITHGKKHKHFIFSDLRQEGAKFLVGALQTADYNLVLDNNLKIRSRESLMRTSGDNVAYLLSSSVYGKEFTVGQKKSVLELFNSRPDNIYGDLARIIVLDSGFKEGIDLFDVKYVHIFEPPTTRANLRQTIGRATRFCGQAGLPFDPNEGWKLSVFLYDIAFGDDVRDVYKISKGSDIIKRYIASDHRVGGFEEELENFCLEVSVDRDLNQFIHQHTLEAHHEVEHPERSVDPLVEVIETEDDIQMIPVIPPIIITKKSKCGGSRATKGVPISTGMFCILAYCLGYSLDKPSGKIDNRELRKYLCGLLSDTSFLREFNRVINDPIETIRSNQEKLKAAFVKGGDFGNIKSSIRSQMVRIVFQALEQGVIDEMERVKRKHRSRKMKKRFIIPEVPGMDREKIEDLPSADPPEEKLSHSELSEYILENYSHCIWPRPKVENQCVFQASAPGPKIVKFTPTQEFIRTYFTPSNPYKGMLIQHGVGCGKTCTAIATSTSTFDREGYKIIWVTRTSLKSDLYKNMFDLVCNAHIKEMIEVGTPIPVSRKERLRLLGKAWSIPPISYRQFSNLVEGKNELFKKLAKINGDADPLRKTLIIIDEAHKLYGGDDMSETERPNLEAFHQSLMNSYSVSGRESARVMLMTATPYTSDPMEFFKLVNLIREPSDQLPVEFDSFSELYLDEAGRFTDSGRKTLLDQLAGQISYLNRQNDIRQFAQVHTHHILVNQRNLTDQELDDDIETLNQKLLRMESQMTILEGMLKAETKKKYGRRKEDQERKQAAISRIEFEIEDLEERKERLFVELQHYIELYNDMNAGNIPDDYISILDKKCFKKIKIEE